MPKVLLVDDEALVRRSMQKTLLRKGFVVETAENCSEGLEVFKAALKTDARFDVALLDLNMPNFDGVPAHAAGLDLLSKLIEVDADLAAVVLTAYDEVDTAKDAVQRGARSYFVKGREQGLVDLINEIMGIISIIWGR
ncbi:MAG: response regulator [Anaerolineae bacterium]|jgi:two-component system, NtrC family, response regulator HydG|nr:response regulator [Anaerolineae bacterium]MBT7072817.1 response regulator [Anaerolineae bacterium]MBT7323777.1 response regulator [Anaerolineae bacterium]